MRDLVVRHGENLARARVENFQTQFVLYRQPALLPENPVEMDRRIHVGDAVFGK